MPILTLVTSLVGVSLWLAACSSTPIPHSPEQVPEFRLILEEGLLAKREVKIEIHVPGQVKRFTAPASYGGGPMFLNFVSNISAVDSRGQKLPLDIQKNHLHVDAGTTPYSLSYTYKIPQENPGDVDQSIPFLSAKRARFDNNVTFVVPETLENVPARLKISAPETWPVFTSWGKGREFKIAKVSELTAGGEVLGEYAFSEQKIAGTNVVFALEGDFSHAILKSQFAKILSAQQSMVGRFPFPQLLVVFQTWKKNEAKGTALPGAFFVNIPAGTKLTPFHFQVMGTVSHELFHEWNLRYIFPATKDGNYLFSEGFTNYFGVAALTRAGLMKEASFGRFLWRYKKFVEENLAYPADHAEIQSGFSPATPNAQLIDLAYTKGMFAAVFIDLALREESGGKQSLASWFSLLVERYGDKKGYSVGDLRATLGEISGHAEGRTVQVFDEAFVGGKKLDLASLIERFGIRCNKNDECTLQNLDPAGAILRTKVFSGRR